MGCTNCNEHGRYRVCLLTPYHIILLYNLFLYVISITSTSNQSMRSSHIQYTERVGWCRCASVLDAERERGTRPSGLYMNHVYYIRV